MPLAAGQRAWVRMGGGTPFPAAASWWVTSCVLALMGSCHHAALPLSLVQGQPVPTTSSYGAGKGPLWGGAALAGGCW